MAGFINIGFGNIVNRDKIVAVVSPDAAPVKRMVQQGKEEKIVIDRRNSHDGQIKTRLQAFLELIDNIEEDKD